MKRTITIVLILVLTVCLFAGCRNGNGAESMVTEASQAIDNMMPSSDSGAATDHDGFIGDENNTTNSTTGSTHSNDNSNGSANGGSNSGANGGASGATNGGTNEGTNNATNGRGRGFLPIHY